MSAARRARETPLNAAKRSRTIPDCPKLSQTVPDCTKLYQTVPNCTKLYQTVPNCTKLYRSCRFCQQAAWRKPFIGLALASANARPGLQSPSQRRQYGIARRRQTGSQFRVPLLTCQRAAGHQRSASSFQRSAVRPALRLLSVFPGSVFRVPGSGLPVRCSWFRSLGARSPLTLSRHDRVCARKRVVFTTEA